MVFQNYALFPHLNVFENVAFGLRARHAAKAEMNERVASALELVQLPGYEKRAIDRALGRPATTRGDRARDRDRAGVVAV